MKIVLAGQNFRITGGSDRVFFDELELLEEHGHIVAPFCARHAANMYSAWSSYFPVGAEFENPGINDAVNYIYSRNARRSVTRLLEDFRPDIFHCHIYYGKLTASIIAPVKQAKIPLVQTLHEFKVVCPTYTLMSRGEICTKCSGFNFHNVIANRCNRESFLRSALTYVEATASRILGAVSAFDHFIAVSDFLRGKVIEMGVPSEKVTTVHNYTDAKKFKPDFNPGDYFLYFGRLERNKGLGLLLEAFEGLPKARLVIVGGGSMESEIKSHIKNNPSGNIDFLGFKTGLELSEIIRRARAVVVPSIWFETFGLTITEAFGHGKPVIASDIGGIPEVVSSGEDAILVEPKNVHALRSAVEDLLVSDTRVSAMGRAGHANLIAKFNSDIHYKKLNEVYEKCRS
ncbi:glycosyltransferase family 4 protein [Variovorax sp. GB1R11]|uniref:glycosyltransferase family 4 protein n=1 Tax=Variovorax sp. GB1R11 TaxID=3443741 RepID=UPI003F47280A